MKINGSKVVAKSMSYYATQENSGFFLYSGCVIDGKFETVFIADFSHLEDFDYEVDKAQEELHYLLQDF